MLTFRVLTLREGGNPKGSIVRVNNVEFLRKYRESAFMNFPQFFSISFRDGHLKRETFPGKGLSVCSRNLGVPLSKLLRRFSKYEVAWHKRLDVCFVGLVLIVVIVVVKYCLRLLLASGWGGLEKQPVLTYPPFCSCFKRMKLGSQSWRAEGKASVRVKGQ